MDSYLIYEKDGGQESLFSAVAGWSKVETEHFGFLYSHTHANIHRLEDEHYLYLIHGELFLRNAEYTPSRNAQLNDNDLVPSFFASYGLEFIDRFKGTFNLFIAHKQEKQLFLITDPLGLFPVFEAEANGARLFSADFWFLRRLLRQGELDTLSLLEYILFNFPHGEYTWDTKIKRAPAGQICTIFPARNRSTYWEPAQNGAGAVRKSGRQTLGFLERHFRETVFNLNRNRPYAVSLTGGFDGRTVLACAQVRDRLTTYTFGAEESQDILYAKKLAGELGLTHTSILLNDSYYTRFFEEAKQYISASNGWNTFERTHYLHAFRMLSEENDYLLSGNGGSEVFRTIKGGGILVSKVFFSALQAGKVTQELLYAYGNAYRLDDYLLFDWKKQVPALKERLEHTLSPYLQPTDTASYGPVFRYILKNTIPNWFGVEMNVASRYIMNRSPYLDADFLEAVRQTPYCACHQNRGETNPIKRRTGQLPYAFIIGTNDAGIAKAQTSKGYAPRDVIRPDGLLRLALAQLRKKFESASGASNRDFNAQKSFENFLEPLNKEYENGGGGSSINLKKLYADIHSGPFDKRLASKLLSIHYWTENLLK